MKIITITVLLLFSCLIISSCSKDDIVNSTQGQTNTELQGDYNVNSNLPYGSTGSTLQARIYNLFTAGHNPTFFVYYDAYAYALTQSFNADSVFLSYSKVSGSTTAYYNLRGKYNSADSTMTGKGKVTYSFSDTLVTNFDWNSKKY